MIKANSRGITFFNGEDLSDSNKIMGIPGHLLQDCLNKGMPFEYAVYLGWKYLEAGTSAVIYNGVIYKSIKQLADTLGVVKFTIKRRLDKGMTLEAAIEDIKNSQPVYNGVIYKNATELAKHEGVLPRVLLNNLRSGMSVDDAVRAAKEYKQREIVYEGVAYPSLTALCCAKKVPYYAVLHRLSVGWDFERAINTPVMPSDSSLEYKGVRYAGIKTLARAVGMNASTLHDRLKRGWTIEEAVETPLGERIKTPRGTTRVSYKGKEYASVKDLCGALGVNYQTISSRLAKGWTIEQAVETPIKTPVKLTNLVVEGVEYDTKQDACDAYNIPLYVVDFRIQSGMSLEDALLKPWVKWQRQSKYTYDSKQFSSLRSLCSYAGISLSTLYNYLDKGYTLDDACQLSKEAINKDIIDLSQYPGCRRANERALRARCNDDMELVREWLKRVYLGYPTEFHGVIYKSVEDACSALSLPLGTIRARMLHTLSFQEAVHDRYFVVDGKVYLNRTDLCKVFNITLDMLWKTNKDVKSNDEFITRLRDITRDMDAFKLNRGNDNISSVVDCRDGRYIVYCAVCGRPLYLTESEARSFEHSDEFCLSHVQPVLYSNLVSATQLRSMIYRKGSYVDALESFNSSKHRQPLQRIRGRLDVQSANKYVKGKFFLITCAVCGRNVMLPYKEALTFSHSDDCERNEWLD